MSFPRYPAYKPSGVEWLGEVPEHWSIIRLKNVLQCRITDGPHTTPEFIDEGVPFLSVDGIQDGELRFDGCRFISEKDHEEFSRKAQPVRDDILMGKAASTGKIARVKTDFTFSIWSPLALIRVDSQLSSPSFYEQALKSAISQAQIDVLCTSNTQKNISMDDIPRLVMTRPTIKEQLAIASFLDHETAKIDALIAEQQRLIELLQEKRQAVISHAVTKGLNPDAPMKDSGVEWLGEVPEHWTVIPLRLAARIESGHTPSRSHNEYWIEKDCVHHWFTLGDVWQIRDGKAEYVYETQEKVSQAGLDNSAARMLPANTVILSRTASVGFSGILGVPMATTQDFVNWVCGPKIVPEFLLFVFRAMSKEFERLKYGSTHNTIYMPDIFSFRAPLPSLIEQGEIVSNVRESLRRLDGSFDDLLRSKELLQERRSALISAAVTGQIDVRGLMPEAVAA
jgi:type I restriction enzyme S subunit